ncbi:MAG: ComF family protein [Tissierellia bacterium]|nr:ComF family protein [Tissierellia bacterium]
MIDHLFQRKGLCYGCGEEWIDDKYLCSTCLNRISPIGGRKKIKGRPLYFPYLYQGLIKEWIHRYKFQGHRYLYRVFVALLLDEVRLLQPEIITTVPVTPRRKRERGYNPPELIAREIGKKLDIPFYDFVEKTKNTKDQHLISLDEKRKNLDDAFRLKKEIPKKEILLFDDVVTSGTTMERMMEAMVKVEQISLLAICSKKPTEYDRYYLGSQRFP